VRQREHGIVRAKLRADFFLSIRALVRKTESVAADDSSATIEIVERTQVRII
jgi:hypothetical protein